MIKKNLSKLTIYVVALMMSLTIMSATSEKFTATEQQQISVPTPGLFAKSNIINIDFTQLPDKEYSPYGSIFKYLELSSPCITG